MDKLKAIFRPGGEEDDQVYYGTPEPKNTHAEGGSHDHEDVLESTKALAEGEHNQSAGQVSGGSFEPAAAARSAGQSSMFDRPSDRTGSDPYGAQGTSHHTHGESAQPIRGTALTRMKEQGMMDSSMSIKSGMQGPYASGQADDLPGSERGNDIGVANTTGTALPDRTREGLTGNSHNERSFPLSGGSTTGTSRSTDPTQAERYGADEAMRSDTRTADQSHLGRDVGLGAGAGALGGAALAHEGRSDPSQSYADPSSTAGRETAGHHIPGDPYGYHQPNEKPTEGVIHRTHGPHATDLANILDPHVPGEFPSESGDDRHRSHAGRDAAIGGAGLGAAGLGYEELKSRDQPTGTTGIDPMSSTSRPGGADYPLQETTNTMPTGATGTQAGQPGQSQHHLGRDAALGAGAAGLGYEATRGHHETGPTSRTADPYQEAGMGTRADQLMTEPTEKEQKHRGTATGVGGLAGVGGGVGAYEYEKERSQQPGSTGPAPNTVGPHKSDGLNIIDPRVQPNASNMRAAAEERKADRQEPMATGQQQPEQHHYGRDAALAGGTGLAGAGAYEAYEDRKDRRHEPTAAAQQQPIAAQQRQPEQHHYGRDAALAGGTGLAGAGAYEAYEDRKGRRDEPVSGTQQQPEQHHYGRDAALAGGAGVAGAGAYEAYEDRHADPMASDGHNKLHKKNDPRGQPVMDDKHEKELQKAREKEAHKHEKEAEKAHEKQEKEAAKHQHELEKAREKEQKEAAKHHQAEEPKKEGLLHRIFGKHDKEEDNSKKHEEEAAAGVGAAGLGAAAAEHRGQHVGSDAGNTDERVIEPHTGLPMNVAKYGTTGQGGIDGNQVIEGYHETDPALRQASHGTAEGAEEKKFHHPSEQGYAGPDWEGIKKANTPY